MRYARVHHVLRLKRGRAADYRCVDCGKPAAQWSYNHRAADEKSDPTGKGAFAPYSEDLSQYDPRCYSCHSLHDRKVSK